MKFKGVCVRWDKGYGFIKKTHKYDEVSKTYVAVNDNKNIFCAYVDIESSKKSLRIGDIVTFSLAENTYHGEKRGVKAVHVTCIG